MKIVKILKKIKRRLTKLGMKRLSANELAESYQGILYHMGRM